MEVNRSGSTLYHDDYCVNYWTPIRITVESFLRPEPRMGLSSFHETFSLVYKCVCDGKAARLYLDLLHLCSSHLKSVNEDLMQTLTADPSKSQVEKATHIIRVFDEELAIYLRASSNISSVFCYLVKFMEEKNNYACPLDAQLKKIFCEEVAEHYVYDILDCLENSPPSDLDSSLIQRLLNNLQVVSQCRYGTRYFKLFSSFGINFPPVTYEHVISARISEVKQLQENIRREQVGRDQTPNVIVGLNPAQKRRADERD